MHPSSLSRRRFLVMATALPGLHACASGVAAPDSATAVADVALVELPDASKLSLTIDKHPDATGSLERALLFSGDIAKGEHLLGDALRADATAGPRFVPSLSVTVTDALIQSLRRAGRSVVVAPEAHHDRIELIPSYPSLGARAALIVDVVPRALGYWAEYPARVYRPWVRLEYREFDLRAKRAIGTGFVGTGPAPHEGAWTQVASSDAFAFATFEALVADPGRAAQGLRAAAALVASALAAKI